MDKKTDKKLNRKVLLLLIAVAIVLAASLAYLYLLNTENTDTQNILSIYGKDDQKIVDLSLDDILSMTLVEDYSSFQNKFGNWRGQGIYKGVRVSDLLGLVDGISQDDNVTIYSTDGYNQTYCYNNVYNAWSNTSLQGEMILAYSYNGTMMLEWENGPMIVFLPPDGAYSNQDCLDTSCPEQGCHIYPSAGSRWVKNVTKIVVND